MSACLQKLEMGVRVSFVRILNPGRIGQWFLHGLAGIFSWVALGLATGLLIVNAVLFVFAGDLPDHDRLASYRPPTISRIFSGEGRLLDEFANQRRLFSPIEEIPPLVRNAFISAEDKNFYQHPGYDPVGMLKALLEAARGERLRGASTITQQVLKNFLLDGGRSIERKVKEILLAGRLEQTLSKDDILELYLNEIFLGQNSYGVTAAAQTYFNKPLEDLTIAEAAYLAALPKAPSRYHPVRERDLALARRNFVISEMVDNGYISSAKGALARQTELKTVMSGDFASFRSSLPPRSYFTEEIRRELSGEFGEDEFFNGGLTIRATIDEELQETAAAVLRNGLEKYDRERGGTWRGTGLRIDAAALVDEARWRTALTSLTLPRDIPDWQRAVILDVTEEGAVLGIENTPIGERGFVETSDLDWVRAPLGDFSDRIQQGEVVFASRRADGDLWTLRQIPEIAGSFMAMDVNTGRVLALQGGFSYQHSVFNRASQASRQPGSAFKPFVYAAALDSGYSPATIVIDAPIETETPEGLWRPKNSSDQFYGPSPLRAGIEYSRNLMTIRLAIDIGMEEIADYAETFGIYEDMDPYLANALGAQETTLLKMVAGYAMFANGGEQVMPTLVDRVQDREGRTIYRHDQRHCLDCTVPNLVEGTFPQIFSHRERVIDPITAFQMTEMLQGVVQRGTARHAVKPGVPVAGKTGTTNDSRDAWFVGYTPDIVAGCYMGFDVPRSLGRRAYGSNLCGPVFNEFIVKAVKRYGSSSFEPPDGGIFVDIDTQTGEPLSSDEVAERPERAVREFFRLGSEPIAGTTRIVDGGFAMASDLGIFDPDAEQEVADHDNGDDEQDSEPQGRGSFGSLSSGGLY